MKVIELMIGDWVYNKHHEKNIKITPFDFFIHGHLPSGAQYFIGVPNLTSGRDLTPIPLTKEILEKNTKVEPIESSPVDYTDYVFDEDTSIVYEKSEPFMFYHESSKRDHIYKKVEYVHELQHLLKLVGYEKEIKL